MICISIANKSRRFALVDLFNAAPQCDLVEVRLDYFDQAPNISELLAHKQKPVIMTCRRTEDGGEWMGREEQRVALLRECLASKADYVEIELDIADQIPAMPPSKRVISYTNLVEVPDDLSKIYQQIVTKKPDIIKLVVPARSPEEVWPVVQILAKPAGPTVVVGVGKPGIMLALLARKVGAPWAFAALEPGMEAYHEQPTIRDLEVVYHYHKIDRTTPFVAVTGFGELQYLTVGLLNAVFARLGERIRCLPLEIGSSALFRKVLDVVKARSAVIDPEHQAAVREVVAELDPSAVLAQGIDLMTHEDGKWIGSNLFGSAVFTALDETLRVRKPEEKTLQGRRVLLVGVNPWTRMLAIKVQRAGGIPLVASSTISAGEKLAEELGCQFIPEEAWSTIAYDVLVRCDAIVLHPEILKTGTTVMDLTALPKTSPLLAEAEKRGCQVVGAEQLLVQLASWQVRAIVGKNVPREVILEELHSLTGGN